MKTIIPAVIATFVLLAGAATTAGQMNGTFNEAFGEKATEITKEDMTTDAKALFARVDVDGSGDLDVDEFAGHQVILAQLARLNRTVTVEGGVEKQIPLPDGVAMRLSETERGAIDAVARRTFHDYADKGRMSADAFAAYRLETMARIDRNRDGVLKKGELERFAALVAKAGSPRG